MAISYRTVSLGYSIKLGAVCVLSKMFPDRNFCTVRQTENQLIDDNNRKIKETYLQKLEILTDGL